MDTAPGYALIFGGALLPLAAAGYIANALCGRVATSYACCTFAT